jgi:hypothetical protein
MTSILNKSINSQINDKISENENILEEVNKRETEGFSEMNPNNLSRQTNQVINSNHHSKQQLIINDLRKEYDKTLQEYNKLLSTISTNVTGYVDRVSSKNPYLNKTIAFNTGHVCYVTKQGVVKYIPSPGVWNSVSAPKNVIRLNIPWLNSYSTPGTIIPTNPPLISGTNVKANQSLGNEGSNVFVDQLLPPLPESTYMGCFATNTNNDNTDFIGTKPPTITAVSIENGNFSNPEIPANSFRYLRGGTVPGWNFNNGILLNNSSAWGYPMPYPGGKQCVNLQNAGSIDTMLSLQSGVNYTLTFMACGRNCCRGTPTSNSIDIELYNNSNVLTSNVANFTPPINTWTSYSYTFTVPTTQRYKLVFKGTGTGDRSAALTSIRLRSDAIPQGTYSYQNCKQAAISNGYRYFGLQNVNTSSGLGYCAVSNSEPAIMKSGRSERVSKMVPLWSSNTGGKPGNTAILTNTGSLQVLDSTGKAVYSTPASTSITATNIPSNITATNKRINSFLILQSDGNMSIFEGTDPNNRKNEIWSSMTAGRQEKANIDVVASKGKYGQNWMSNGSTLSPGDFIGSTDGKIALMMQTDGNLVLYTYQTDTNCEKIGDKIGGGRGANAMYDIGMSADSKNMGALGFIDSDSNLYTYPITNQKYTDTYSKIENINAVGNDIPGKAFANSSIESCKKACDSNPDCVGFVTTRDGSTCWPKNKGMYPFGGVGQFFSGRDTYVKGKQPLTPPIGISSNTTSINSVDFGKYINKGTVGNNKHGLANINNVEKQQLDQLRSKLNMLSKQITDLTDKFQTGSINAEQQSSKNVSGVNQYFKDFNNTNNKISGISEETNVGIENILKDSDIVVLQKNYEYLFWSILAAGTVLVSMNVMKKE